MSTSGFARTRAATLSGVNVSAAPLFLSTKSSTKAVSPAVILFKVSCALRNESPRAMRSRARSTGRLIVPLALMATTTREPDFAGTLAGAFPCCASASLKDNFLDICFRQKFAPNSVEPASTKSARSKALNVHIINAKDTLNTRDAADHIEVPGGASDRDQRYGPF